MKVASIVELYKLNPHGGIAVWSRRLMEYLQEIGISTKVFAYADGITTRLPESITTIPNFREIFIYPPLAKKVFKTIEREYDVLHAMSPHTLAGGKPDLPTVVSIHYLISRQTSMFSKYLPPKYKLYFNFLSYGLFRYHEKRGLMNADCITVSRKAFKEYLIEKMGIPAEKIFIIKYGIDYQFFKPPEKLRAKEKIALFVGRGSLPKGFDTLIQAAPQIKGKIIAVASQIPKEIQKNIDKLTNVRVVSGVSLEELRRLYQEALVFVMPSLTEGSPISTLEAMACGLPVVCTAEGSGEYIEDGINGYIFPFKDTQQMAERVNYLFEHQHIARDFGIYNRAKVETELTMPAIASQIVNLYKRIKGNTDELDE